MICTKCNNEIPDGAKFCPSCGASLMTAPDVKPLAPAPEPVKKFYCEKCGLELMQGAKFCSVCGGSGIARDVQPIERGTAAVSLNKSSQSDSLVSAMNSASASATGVSMSEAPAPAANIPTPVNSVPVPTGSVPVPSNSPAAASSSGYAASAPSPVIPPYVASVSSNAQTPVMPVPNVSGAAAVSTKKGNGGKIALFAILGVLVLAIAAAAVMFFTNRAAFLSTFMGKAKYATMVEGTSIKNATEKLDIPAITNGIKSASGTYQAMSQVMSSAAGSMSNPFMSYDSDNAKTVPLSYGDSSIDPGFNAGFNISELSRELAEMMQNYYGANTVSESLSMNVELSDSVKAMLGAGSVDVDSILELINGTAINYTLSAKDDKSAVTVGTQGKVIINAKVLLDGQNVYVALPFASDKAIMVSVPGSSESVKTNVKPLELDEKEIERLITECVEIYLDKYKAASIEMESGNIKAGGVTVEGKIITAEFKGKKLVELFTDIAKHIVSDDYLMTQIADYANSCGAETTKSDLTENAIREIEKSMDSADNSDKLVIETVIDRNGNVLGKTFKAMEDNDVLTKFSYAETKSQLGFEIISSDDEFSFKATVDKIDDKSGSCNIKFTYDEDEMSFILNYSDVKEAEFCGKEICTGSFSLGMNLPESFSDQLGKDAFAAINGMKLNFGLAADSKNTIEYSIGFEVPSYGSVSIKDVFTVMDDDSAFTKPSNVIDATEAVLGVMPDETTRAELEKFVEDIENAFKNAIPEFIANELDNLPGSSIGGIDGPTVYPGSSSIDDKVADLLDDIKDDMEDIQKALNGELTYSSNYTSSELENMLSDYTTLYLEIIVKGNSITAKEFEDFEDRYWDLYIDLPYFGDPSSAAFGYESGSPRIDALNDRLDECLIDMIGISYKIDHGNISDKTTADKLYSEIETAVTNLSNYCDSTGEYLLTECTDEQLAEIERLLGIAEQKIDAFEAKFGD